MKTPRHLIAILALACSGAAIGAEPVTTPAPVTSAASDASDASAASAVVATVAASAKPAHALTRAEVQAQVIAARENGTLIETEADMDVAQTRKHYAR